MERFSIIIPVYNVEIYLEQCLQSVLCQSFTNLEAILVDDGSTDQSGKICDEYAARDKRLKVLHTENEGLSAARNKGILVAQGEYVILLDSDDYLDIKALENLEKALKAEDYDVIVNAVCRYDDREKKVYPCAYCFGEEEFRNKKNYEVFEKLINKKDFTFAAWAFVLRREYLLCNHLFFVPGILHEDELWTPYVILKARKIYYCNEHFYYYRENRKDSIMNRPNIARAFSLLQIIEQLMEASVLPVYNEKECALLRYRAADIYLTMIFNLGEYRKEPRYRELLDGLKGKQKLLLVRHRMAERLMERCISVFGLECIVFFIQCKKKLRTGM